MSAVLKTQSITESFLGVVVLSDIAWEIEKGEIQGLMGENGSGKSTLPPILLRLCDRTLVINERSAVARFERTDADQEKLLGGALGVTGQP